MSLVFRNALMPSENQQVLRLRLAYLMRRFLFLALGLGLLSPNAAIAHSNNSLEMGLVASAIGSLCKAQARGYISRENVRSEIKDLRNYFQRNYDGTYAEANKAFSKAYAVILQNYPNC